MCVTSPDSVRASAQTTPHERSYKPASVESSNLLDAQGQLIIEHRGKRYQLRETRNGKLILTS